MLKDNKVKIAIGILAIIAIVVITLVSKYNFSLYFQKNARIEIYLLKDFNIDELKNELAEVFENQEYYIEKAREFKDVVSITTTEISDEQLEKIVSKLNEKYETELTVEDDTNIIYNSNVRGRDIFTPFIGISIAAVVITVAIIAVLYTKQIGIVKAIVMPVAFTVASQILYLFILAITRVQINKFTSGIAVLIYIITLTSLIARFEKMKETK